MQADTGSSGTLPESFPEWLGTLFPGYVKRSFAAHHERYWNWTWAIEPGEKPATPAIVGIWPRGGAKSTSAEMGTVALGARGKRRYALYVSGTQDQADNHVQTIGSMLESETVAKHYPSLGKRHVGKYGNSQGWRRNRLWTDTGFIIDAVGLDTAVRGLKLEDARPDLIILDDIDHLRDTVDATEKKLETIAKSILPAGSNDVAVIAIQNLIIPDGVFSRILNRKTDILGDRIMLGPIPALENLEYQERDGMPAMLTKGEATWAGQTLEDCQRLVDLIGITGFLEECQHEVGEIGTGKLVYPQFNPARHIKEPPIGWLDCKWRIAALDPGGGDPTAILPIGITESQDIYVFDEFYETDTVNDLTISDFLSRWPGLHAVAVGETGGNFTVNTLQRLGFPAFKPDMNRGDGFRTVRGWLENGRLFVAPKCKNTITEFGLYRFQMARDDVTGERYATSIPGKRHGDAMDALRYGVVALTNGLPTGQRGRMPVRQHVTQSARFGR